MTGQSSRTTREDVARLAGTSVAVVSYVVNNGPRPVAAATRERVLSAIQATGYRPNGIAKALVAGSTRTYGLVVPDISNPFFAEVAHALEDEVFSQDRVLLLGDSAESKEREQEIVNIFLQRRVDGLLYIGVDRHPHVDEIVTTGTPVVVLDRIDDDSPAASVVIDNFGGSRAAVQHLVSHGYWDIACIAGPDQLSVSQDRRSGWEAAMTEAGLPIRAEWRFKAAFSRQGGMDVGHQLVDQENLPRAVFASNDQQAVGLLGALYQAGLRVPEDVAVISFDGTDDSMFSIPALSTVRQPIETIAKHAVGLLIRPETYESNRIVCPFELVLRRSCGCPPPNRSPQSVTVPLTQPHERILQ